MSGGAPAPSRSARVGVVVPAAGSGERLGGVPKAFLELAGAPLLERALTPFLEEPRVMFVVVALMPRDAAAPPSWIERLDARVAVVAGGSTRSQSVRAGIAALPAEVDVIAVHDAARPLVTGDVVSRCIELALEGFGAVAGCPAVDTLKRVGADASVVETPERAAFWHAQTPQVFPADILRRAYADPEAEGTDDSALVERAGSGTVVRMVDAGPANLKVTRPLDLPLAEAILRSREGGRGS